MKGSLALRYAAPNILTTANLIFGMLSLQASVEGRFVDAAWLIIYAVLTDRLDGFVARLVRGTSELGVQLDSFADSLNFGVAPAVLFYTSLSAQPELPFQDGTGNFLLLASCAFFLLSAIFRLARYNITTGETTYPKIFFGVPTTLIGGLIVIWYLALLKYTPEGAPMFVRDFGGMHLFGDIQTPVGVWKWFPVVLLVGGFFMASTLRMPKLGLLNSRSANIFIFSNVFLGYVFGFVRLYPEYMVWPPTLWLVVFLTWGALSPSARAMKPPPLFPEEEHPPGEEPIRPEDDMLPVHEIAPLDPPPDEPQG
jgi:CDP-diacylglycerol--serine O-phosphatidyltransferase